MELTDEQIAKLTPEQVTELENNPDAVAEILAGQKKAPEEPNDESEQEEEEDGAATGADEDEEDQEQEQDEEKEQESEPVVLTKNGKGTIPYEKYKELRVENATLRDRVAAYRKPSPNWNL